MSIWGILFFIILALWLLYEYIVLMGKLYLEYLVIAKLKKEIARTLSEVGKKALISNREIENVINKIEKEISIYDYSEWISFKETFKKELTKALAIRLTKKVQETRPSMQGDPEIIKLGESEEKKHETKSM